MLFDRFKQRQAGGAYAAPVVARGPVDPLLARLHRIRVLSRPLFEPHRLERLRNGSLTPSLLQRFERRLEAIAINRTTAEGDDDDRNGFDLMAERLTLHIRETSSDSALAERGAEAAEAAYILGMIAIVEELQDIIAP